MGVAREEREDVGGDREEMERDRPFRPCVEGMGEKVGVEEGPNWVEPSSDDCNQTLALREEEVGVARSPLGEELQTTCDCNQWIW